MTRGLLTLYLALISSLALSLEGYRVFSSAVVRIVSRQLSPLHDWVISQGAKDSDIKLLFDDPVRASSSIKKGDVIFSIPLGSCIEVIFLA